MRVGAARGVDADERCLWFMRAASGSAREKCETRADRENISKHGCDWRRGGVVEMMQEQNQEFRRLRPAAIVR